MAFDEEFMRGRLVAGGRWGVNWQDTVTRRGYKLANVRSALIKELRFGEEEPALYWLIEMLDISPKVEEAIWDDLGVFALEDVGLADPHALIVVDSAHRLWQRLPTDDARRRLAYAHAICYLARAKKSRYVNELLAHSVLEQAMGADRPIPDRALDMHTRDGRGLERGMLHYLTKAATLKNEDRSFPTVYREEAVGRAEIAEGARRRPE